MMRGRRMGAGAVMALLAVIAVILMLRQGALPAPSAPALPSGQSSIVAPDGFGTPFAWLGGAEMAELDDVGVSDAPGADREAAAGPILEDLFPTEDAALSLASSDPAAEHQAPPPAAEDSPAPPRVGIQAGHWKSAELPDELSRLRTSTGTSGGGKAEWELNLDVARRAVALLLAEGIEAEVIPATVPTSYKADAFVALHADGDATGRLSGFKLARPSRSVIPEVDDALLAAIAEEYGAVTRMPEDSHISRAMLYYYVFAGRRLQHSLAPTTPAVILEMGFMTNPSDLRFMLGNPDIVAEGIARGVLRFLAQRGT